MTLLTFLFPFYFFLAKSNRTTSIQWTGRWRTEAMLLGYVQDLVKTERFHTKEDAERWACLLNDDDEEEEAPFTRANVHVSSNHTSKVFSSTISSLKTAASVKSLHFGQKKALTNSMILHLRY